MKVFLDPHVIVSALAVRGLCADMMRVLIQVHDLIICTRLVAELRQMLRRTFGVSAPRIEEADRLLRCDTIEVREGSLRELPLADAADIALVFAAPDGSADAFVTGDRQILALHRVGSMEMRSPREFWQKEQRSRRTRPTI